MPVLAAGIMALSTFSQKSSGTDPEQIEAATTRLIAKAPTLAAFGYNSLSYVQNFIRMSFGFPTEPYEFNDQITKALETLLILHVDHEQNCSTSTVRMVASSGANMYAAVAAGVNALSGPKHGGANQAVLEMLQYIRDSDMTTKEFVRRVKDKQSDIKLMGFGHRIYKNYDPRAAIIKKHADRIMELHTGREDLLEIAKELEETALSDDYFKERKLYPNVDFYTGLIYEAMGFPMNMFTVLFALGRLPCATTYRWISAPDCAKGPGASAPGAISCPDVPASGNSWSVARHRRPPGPPVSSARLTPLPAPHDDFRQFPEPHVSPDPGLPLWRGISRISSGIAEGDFGTEAPSIDSGAWIRLKR